MDLDPLRIAAALVSPYPTWRVEAPDEPSLLERLAVAGPVPQADLFEPWEPTDPWSARVLWPEMSDPDVLLAQGRLEDGMAPGLSEWMDRGRVGEDLLISGAVEAVCFSDLEQGGLLTPDLVHLETDAPDIVAVALALLAAVGARGDDDQVTLVQHRTTGRMGLLLEVRVPDTDPRTERQAVIDGVASVVGSDAPVKLSPDLQWWFDLQRMTVLAWLVVPAQPVLPTARFDTASVDLTGEPGPCELQVQVDEEGGLVLGEALGEAGFAGSRSRWLTANESDGRVFVSCWTGPADATVGIDAPHRRVPGCPPGLEGDWLGIDPSWWVSGGRVVCRWHCGLRDRDLLPVVETRDGDAVDRELAATLSALGEVEPVMAGRPGLRLLLPSLDETAWTAVIEALGALADHRVAPVAYVGMRHQFTVLLFRTDLPYPEVEPAWEAKH